MLRNLTSSWIKELQGQFFIHILIKNRFANDVIKPKISKGRFIRQHAMLAGGQMFDRSYCSFITTHLIRSVNHCFCVIRKKKEITVTLMALSGSQALWKKQLSLSVQVEHQRPARCLNESHKWTEWSFSLSITISSFLLLIKQNESSCVLIKPQVLVRQSSTCTDCHWPAAQCLP